MSERALEGSGQGLCVSEGRRLDPIHGRQDKSAAIRRAQAVGWIEIFSHPPRAAGWRIRHFSHHFQCLVGHPRASPTSDRPMTPGDDDIQIRPGWIRHGNRGDKRPKSFVAEVMKAAKKAGHVGPDPRSGRRRKGRSTFGRGRQMVLSWASRSPGWRVTVTTRIVRHHSSKFRSASLARHVTFLKRDGLMCDGADARMYDARSVDADAKAFSERCEEDRHHFRFIISPEDAADLENLRTFTRELMKEVERDLATPRGQARLSRSRSLEYR